jgi:hypothetical protein
LDEQQRSGAITNEIFDLKFADRIGICGGLNCFAALLPDVRKVFVFPE